MIWWSSPSLHPIWSAISCFFAFFFAKNDKLGGRLCKIMMSIIVMMIMTMILKMTTSHHQARSASIRCRVWSLAHSPHPLTQISSKSPNTLSKKHLSIKYCPEIHHQIQTFPNNTTCIIWSLIWLLIHSLRSTSPDLSKKNNWYFHSLDTKNQSLSRNTTSTKTNISKNMNMIAKEITRQNH